MAFEPGRAVVVTDENLLATYGRAFRKIGKSVVVVPLGTGIHGCLLYTSDAADE